MTLSRYFGPLSARKDVTIFGTFSRRSSSEINGFGGLSSGSQDTWLGQCSWQLNVNGASNSRFSSPLTSIRPSSRHPFVSRPLVYCSGIYSRPVRSPVSVLRSTALEAEDRSSKHMDATADIHTYCVRIRNLQPFLVGQGSTFSG
jgi:hypothetical protein